MASIERNGKNSFPKEKRKEMKRKLLFALLLGVSCDAFSGEEAPFQIREFNIEPVPSGPAIINVAPDGSLWFAAPLAKEIMQYSATGKKLLGVKLEEKSFPVGVAIDKNGMIWFTDAVLNTINRYDPKAGRYEKFEIPTKGSWPFFIKIDSLNRVWFTERAGDKIGRFDPTTETFVEMPLGGHAKQPAGMTITSDDHIFFTENTGHKIGHVAPGSEKVQEIPIPSELKQSPAYGLAGICAAPNGDIWFAELDGRLGQLLNEGGKYENILEHGVPNAAARPAGVYVDSFGCVWFTELDGNRIVRFTPSSNSFDGVVIPTGEPDPEPRAPVERSARGAKASENDAAAKTSRPFGIYGDDAGRIWFTEQYGQRLGVVEPLKENKYQREVAIILKVDENVHSEPAPITNLAVGDKVSWVSSSESPFVVEDRSGLFQVSCDKGKGYHTFSIPGEFDVIARRNTEVVGTWRLIVGNPRIQVVSYALPEGSNVPGVIDADGLGGIWFTVIGGFPLPGLGHLPPGEQIGRVDLTGKMELFRTPKPGSAPTSLKVAGDGTVWFTQRLANSIGVWEPGTRSIKEFALPSQGSEPVGIAIDEKRGRVWFTARGKGQIGYVDRSSGEITMMDTPLPNSEPSTIAVDWDNNVWFDERRFDNIVRLDPETSVFKSFQIPTQKARVIGVTPDPEKKRILFLELAGSKLGVLDPSSGQIAEIALRSPESFPFKLAISKEGAVFFTEVFGNRIGMWTGAELLEFDLPRTKALPGGICIDRKGNIWFTEQSKNVISMIPKHSYHKYLDHQ